MAKVKSSGGGRGAAGGTAAEVEAASEWVPGQRATINDIARLAGVSKKTVSRVSEKCVSHVRQPTFKGLG